MASRPYTADELALMRRLIEAGLTVRDGTTHLPGRSQEALREAAKRYCFGQWKKNQHIHPPDLVQTIRRAWDDTDMTATEIGELFGMSKNAIIGLANRNGWQSRSRGGRHAKTTLADRMDALHAMMDRVLAENPPGTGRLTVAAEAAEYPASVGDTVQFSRP